MIAACFRGNPFHHFIAHLTHLYLFYCLSTLFFLYILPITAPSFSPICFVVLPFLCFSSPFLHIPASSHSTTSVSFFAACLSACLCFGCVGAFLSKPAVYIRMCVLLFLCFLWYCFCFFYCCVSEFPCLLDCVQFGFGKHFECPGFNLML